MWQEISWVLRWWLASSLLGWAAWPFVQLLFGRLPSKGYAYSKLLGLFLTGWLFWWLAIVGWTTNSLGGILFALTCLLILGIVWARWQNRPILFTTLHEDWRFLLISELLFLGTLLFWAWVRTHNPLILNTEKPMEFAFLNSALISPNYPPRDPWLSGFSISYYYFGYVLMSILIRLSAVPAAVGFNLSIAWIVAATATAAWGLVYDLVHQLGHKFGRYALIAATIAALSIPFAGSLEMWMELAHARGMGSDQFWAWLDLRDDLQAPATFQESPRYQSSGWWWWRASRIINERHLNGEESGLEPITEMPAFSFILGDLHPHVLALPFALLSIALALTWFQTPLTVDRWLGLRSADPVRLLLTTLIIGGLAFLNTWDVLIHLFILVGAMALRQWRTDERWTSEILWSGFGRLLFFIVATYLLYWPFFIGFTSQAGAPFILPMLVRPTRLPQFALQFGLFLWPILPFTLYVALQKRGRFWQRGTIAALSLTLTLFALMVFMGWLVSSAPDGQNWVADLANQLGLTLPLLEVGSSAIGRINFGLRAIFTFLPTLLSQRLQSPWLILLLAALFALCVMLLSAWSEAKRTEDSQEESASSSLPFLFLLILTGVLLTIGPEFLYLKDNFGQRLNTIFKFYYQAWLLWGVASAVGMAYLWQRQRILGLLITGGYLFLLGGALLYPYYGMISRSAEYGTPRTLDGMAQLAQHHPGEMEAIAWLAAHHTADTVIVEAVEGQYSDFGRFSARTGVPTVLGWPGHEHQWRSYSNPEPSARETAITTLYNTTHWDEALTILQRYNITHIIVGRLERNKYNSAGLEKFAQTLDILYQNEDVTIYGWSPRQ